MRTTLTAWQLRGQFNMRVFIDLGKILLGAKNSPINVQYRISRMTNGNFWDQKHYDDEKLSSIPDRQVVGLQD